MYHLIVVGNPEAYNGEPITLERHRVLSEYTNATLSERYGQLSDVSIAESQAFPRPLRP